MGLRRILPLLMIGVLILYDDRISIPSCKVVVLPDANPEGRNVDGQDHNPDNDNDDDDEDLKVMMVANLLLLGSEAGYFNLFFRDYYLSKFFKKSFEILKPDMLLVLGDVSARGAKLSKGKWSSVIQQFHGMLGPFLGLPFHVILGDRDIGSCSGLNAGSVSWIAGHFPGLDSSGCAAFEINNISFVSLNSVALLCGDNKLRFGVEKAVERESTEMQMEIDHTKQPIQGPTGTTFGDSGWRENAMSSGSGPVLLLHVPLHQTASNFWGGNMYEKNPNYLQENTRTTESRGLAGTGPYKLQHTLPPNATEYIFQALRPRIIFSAHTNTFSDRTHSDGTREVTVPAMSWEASNDPGFVVATFTRNGKVVTVSHCLLASESNVLYACTSLIFLLILSLLVTHSSSRTNSVS